VYIVIIVATFVSGVNYGEFNFFVLQNLVVRARGGEQKQTADSYIFTGQLITGNVVITRSPALHPGDVQCVTAVDVPTDSPLRALHNVVVFSSRGQRDLPSQLSGGDLDGDLYNIIYDNSLYPKQLAHPADYLTAVPIDIGQTVERSDMTDFFIAFMENDNLGLIATLHQILADQHENGTFDPQCILLAELHSTAVDFSKTGIPVSHWRMAQHDASTYNPLTCTGGLQATAQLPKIPS